MRSLSRELILPALRLEVPPPPAREHLAAMAQVSADEWTTSPTDWITSQVIRLAVAELLEARFAQAGPERTLPADAAEVTMAQVAGLFRPHVDLAAQAFRVAVVEAVNAGVPAAVDAVREGLHKVGITGRDPLWMLALGLDKVPPRARETFWTAAKGSVGLTALLAELASASDVSGLDRSHLAHADALVQAGGRTIALDFDRPRAPAGSWLKVPLVLSLTTPWRQTEPVRTGVVVGMRGEGWLEVFDTALTAVSTAMAGIDLGGLPKNRAPGRASILAERLVAGRTRSLAEVLASLRSVHPWVAESYGPQVRTVPVRVAIAAADDDQLVQLWLPTSALAGPLVSGAADLFLGGRAQVRTASDVTDRGRRLGGKPDSKPQGRPQGRPGGRPDGSGQPGSGQPGGGRRGRPGGNGPGANGPGAGGPGGGGPGGGQRRGKGPREPRGPREAREPRELDAAVEAAAAVEGGPTTEPSVVSAPEATPQPTPQPTSQPTLQPATQPGQEPDAG